MKNPKSTLLALAAAALLTAGVTPLSVPQAHAQISVQFGWQQPPQEYSPAQRDGFHKGIEDAHHDIQAGRPPDPRRHDDFRHPNVPPDQRDAYRHAFWHGYQSAYQHRGDWGFHDHHHDWDNPQYNNWNGPR